MNEQQLSDILYMLNKCKLENDMKYLDTAINYLDTTIKFLQSKNKFEKEDSWVGNPDRSGGQFTNEEINRKHWI